MENTLVTRFEPLPGLDEAVAARIALPAVRRVAADARDHARSNAPDGKVWVTAHDERVRPSHKHADGQVVPDNLRYLVPKPGLGGDGEEVAPEDYEQAVKPRDENLSDGNRYRCRCESVPLHGAIARMILLDDALNTGVRASARVSVRFPRIVESEHPSEPDRGGGWFRQAVAETVASMPRR